MGADEIRNKIDEDAAERLFFEAIHQDHDCSRGWYDPSTGIVDGQAGEIVAALLKFGWKPPEGKVVTTPESGEIFEPMNDTRTETFCGRCGVDVSPLEIETVAAVHWVPADDIDSGRNELINTFCMPCWRLIVAAIPPAG